VCGKSYPEIQGVPPAIDTFKNTQRQTSPWHVSIFRFRRDYMQDSFIYKCGGTLIPGQLVGEMFVITAASCVTETEDSFKILKNYEDHLRVVTGPVSWNYNTNTKDTGSESYQVGNFFAM